MCQLDEPLASSSPAAPAASTAAPAASTAVPAASTAAPSAAPSPSSPAVQRLVAAHTGASASAPSECRAEGVAVAMAATKTAFSLVKVVASAPTEVGLLYTVAGFVLDAANLGAATAKLVNCEQAKNGKAAGP